MSKKVLICLTKREKYNIVKLNKKMNFFTIPQRRQSHKEKSIPEKSLASPSLENPHPGTDNDCSVLDFLCLLAACYILSPQIFVSAAEWIIHK